jgi:hypothetical protein
VGALSLAAFWSTGEEFTLTQWVAVVAFSVIIPYLQYELAEIFAADLHRADDYLLRGQRITELEGERETLIKRVSVVEAALRVRDVELEAERAQAATNATDMKVELDAAKKLVIQLQTEVVELIGSERTADMEINALRESRDEARANIAAAMKQIEGLKADLVAMTGARDAALSQRDNWRATALRLEQYDTLRAALNDGPVVLGRNQILLPEPFTTAKGIYVPFQVVNNNDPRLKKTSEEFAE